MNLDFTAVLHLLHGGASGTLATHSVHAPGYPFASMLPFSLDERHRPVFLISRLAEHTANLLADGRASLLVHRPSAGDGLAGERLTLLGDAERFDAPDELAARHLRYQPEAQRYLELGDFAFFRLLPKRARYIGGFGRMGWIDHAEWEAAATLSLRAEQDLVARLDGALQPDARLLGIDCYGLNIERGGRRERCRFPDVPLTPENIEAAIRECLYNA